MANQFLISVDNYRAPCLESVSFETQRYVHCLLLGPFPRIDTYYAVTLDPQDLKLLVKKN